MEENREFTERVGYDVLEKVLPLFQHFKNQRAPYERLWKLLDAYDRGFFWEAINKELPGYYIKPDTNYINYIKQTLVNGLYSGAYRGDVTPRSSQHKHIGDKLNRFLEYVWTKFNIPYKVMRAGERAALLNVGVLQFGWKADVIGKADNRFTGDLECRFLDIMSVFPDPAVVDPDEGKAIFIAEEKPLIELINEPRFRKRARNYLDMLRAQDNKEDMRSPISLDEGEYGKGYYNQRPRLSEDGTARLLTCYYKHATDEGYRIDQIWLIDNGYILDIKTNILPKTFPIKFLYCVPPVTDPYGTPITKLVLNNAMTVNILDSIETTHIYASQKRPKIINKNSGIDFEAFAKYGSHPDRLWVSNGAPQGVVEYLDLPDLPGDRHLIYERLDRKIKEVSGLDEKYTGRDTGSVQTTGGVEAVQQRVSLTDNGRVVMLANFIGDITKLILQFYIEFGGERQFPTVTKQGRLDEIMDINFDELQQNEVEFDLSVNVTPHLPNNVARRSQAADIIMEKQMQYQFQPPLMTPEEWLANQDFPNKHEILDRIEADRMQDDMQELMSDMANYAGLVQQGVRPEEAVKMLAQERALKRQQPGLGNVGGGSPQARQKG